MTALRQEAWAGQGPKICRARLLIEDEVPSFQVQMVPTQGYLDRRREEMC